MDPIAVTDNFVDRCHILGTAKLDCKDLIYYYYNYVDSRNIVYQVATQQWYETTASFQATTVYFLHEAGCENNYFIDDPEVFGTIIQNAGYKSTDEILDTIQWSDLYSLTEAVVFNFITI